MTFSSSSALVILVGFETSPFSALGLCPSRSIFRTIPSLPFLPASPAGAADSDTAATARNRQVPVRRGAVVFHMNQPPFDNHPVRGGSECPATGLRFPLPHASAVAIGWTSGKYREIAGGCKKVGHAEPRR